MMCHTVEEQMSVIRCNCSLINDSIKHLNYRNVVCYFPGVYLLYFVSSLSTGLLSARRLGSWISMCNFGGSSFCNIYKKCAYVNTRARRLFENVFSVQSRAEDKSILLSVL